MRVVGTQCKGLTFLLSGVAAVSCGNSNAGQNMAGGVPEFAVETLEPVSVDLKTTIPATIRGLQDVEIRPRVSGFITKLCVDEGAVVKKGQPLFLIDKVQYEAARNAAEAAVKVAEANVATNRLTVKNKTDLQAQNIISEYDLEMAQNTLKTAEAQLAQAKAQLVSAEQDLAYTTVTSPSDGVVGSIPFRVGSLVSSSSAEPLTVVSDISKMYVYFTMNEKQLLEMTRRDGASLGKMVGNMPEVELMLADGSVYPQKGRIETLTGVIDTKTGSFTLRALFPNTDYVLRSGGTGNVLIPSQLDSALMVPQKATSEIQDKKFVYVLQPDSTVKNTPVEVFNLDDGKNYVVTSGLRAGDRIVVEGVATLKDGAKIKAITPAEAAARLNALSGAAGAAQQQARQ